MFGATRLKEITKISYLKSACLITPFGRWNQVNPTIFEICLLYKQQQQISIWEIFKCEIRTQHACLPLLTFVSKSLGSFLISTNLFTLCKQQQQIFI